MKAASRAGEESVHTTKGPRGDDALAVPTAAKGFEGATGDIEAFLKKDRSPFTEGAHLDQTVLVQ
jgi:hypothetical protein